ncbi:MAG TPA: DNA polymerase IV [Roseiarcus sp.]|nr:DNA polymerase IV [Roseiarcus sp.]
MSAGEAEAGPARFCRDCLAEFAFASDSGARCPRCASPRIVRAPRASDLTIAHVDCDAFYASIEKRDDPSLADTPLIVGGGGRRGVVATCCYIARTYGVRSAMPTGKALSLCPQAVVLRPDMAKYARVGREIRERMQRLTPLVEPLSIDEAFLDLTGCEGANGAGAAVALARFAREIESQVGVTVSVGLSYCKFLAKLASDLDKPRGFSVVAREDAIALLAPMGVGRLWGVGKVAEERLARLGLKTIGDLQALDEPAAARLGEDGRRLWRLARGIDDRRVTPDRETKSVSSETTFEDDVSDRAELTRVLLAHCERVAARLRKSGLAAGGVTLKLRTPDFKLRTRTRSGLAPTQMAPRLFAVARALLEAQEEGTSYRLIGVGASDLKPASEADEADLIEGDRGREKAREAAIEALRDKFGASAIQRGLAFKPGAAPRKG